MSIRPQSDTNTTHRRRSLRLKGYDYSQTGAYFITLCTHNRECLFGDIIVGAGSKPAHMALNECGEIVKRIWNDLPNHIVGIELNDFGIMPNHIHGIITIVGMGVKRAGLEPAPTGQLGLSEIVRQLKTFSARRINENRGTPGVPVWQRNYYEHIIRNERSYADITSYIENNPVLWETDRMYVRLDV